MPNPVQIKDFPHIHSGATPASQTKLTDLLVIEHMDAPSSTDKTLKMMIGQLLCKPVFTVASQQSGNGRYSATCQNYAGFSLFYTDSQNARHYFIGLPIKVIFTPACNYGSVSGNTYPTISFNGSDFIPILANGKTVASGAWHAGQSLEGCIIQTNLNGATVYAFDLNSNIRQQDSNSTIYSDGRTEYKNSIYKTQIIELPVNTDVEYTVSTGYAYIFIASGSNYAHYAGIMVLPYNQNGSPQQLIKWAGANITADAATFGKVIFRQTGGGTVNLSVFRIFM